MWTPKRILILIAATFVFAGGFVVYDYYLGGYDGLPPLPEQYRPNPTGDVAISDPRDPETDQKMRIAFGNAVDDFHESRRKFILNSVSRSLLLSVDHFTIEDDGRVKLAPFSVALFSKKKTEPGAYPEVNTIQSDVAYLTLDRKAQSFTDLSSRRIIGVELRGQRGVTIINNRRTAEKNDDIEVNIKLAPVVYEERSNKIWSEGFVRLLDTAPQPNPTEITAKGLELQLTKDATKESHKKGESVGDVEYLILKSHVEMHLYIDARNGFLIGAQDPPAKPDMAKPDTAKPDMDRPGAPPPGAAPAEKSHVIVRTRGPMHYDLPKEQAQFDIPAPGPGSDPAPTDQVLVMREHKVGPKDVMVDQLTCDSLKLQFRRKAAGAAGPKDSVTGDKEIESALALARPGREVTLSMDTERNMEAYGSELFFACATPTAGSRTVLKGTPLHAIRDGNVIECLELHLFGPDKNGNGQHTFAKGPGKIDLLARAVQSSFGDPDEPKDGDAKPAQAEKPMTTAVKPRHTMHALWKDNLIATKDRDGNRVFDLLTFTGDACFIDDDHQQSLHGQRLQVWLEQTSGPAGNKQQAGGGARQKPYKVEAFERVTVQSPEMQIDQCHHLIVRFKDEPARDDRLPSPVLPVPLVPGGAEANPRPEPTPISTTPMVELKAPLPEVRLPDDPNLGPMDGGPQRPPRVALPGNGAAKDKPRQPIRLKAHDVVAYVSTQGTKKQLQELVTEGNVHVQQDGETPKDKGLDITGDMLNLIYHPLGNRLLVYGDSRRPARLQIGELTLVGPKVDIDQKDNTAAVDGIGAMRMPSNTNFDGGKPAKQGTYVDIHWKKDMLFNGKFAQFHGGVEAHQEKARLLCQSMQVTLDSYVSFKEGQKENQNAKVDKLVCDRKVWIEDTVLAADGKPLMLKLLTGANLDMDNPDGRLYVPGPGTARQLAYGTIEVGLRPVNAPKSNAPAPKQDLRLILTRVDFEGSMWGNNKPGGPQIAKFYDNVEVYHQPGDSLHAKVKPNEPPKDGFYLRCNNLTISKYLRDGKTYQYMVAENNASFRTPEFFGNAKTIKYDESQEIIIFEGEPTVLYKFGAPGEKPKRIEGRKILYNRKTGNFDLKGGTAITSWLSPLDGNTDRLSTLFNTNANGRSWQPSVYSRAAADCCFPSAFIGGHQGSCWRPSPYRCTAGLEPPG